jgi:cellulase (glycosyl hydrolase family 5)
MRLFLGLLAVVGTALGIGLALLLRDQGSEPIVLPHDPMPGRLLVGLQDDPSFRWSVDRAAMLDTARDANVSVLRTIVAWKDTAPTRPANAADSFDPAYRLDDVDDLVRSAQQRGMEILVTIWGTPDWANGGQPPNRPPRDPADLEDFAAALADRYSGRHAGFPAVRLFSAWNEPNLEQFLAPQFDSAGRSVGPALYAPLARAVYEGVKRGNPDALVAIGETSPRGHDVPARGPTQDSHSPARFARLLSEVEPAVRFDAWAQHPYPPRPDLGPAEPVRWPRVGIGNLERFGAALDEWFGREVTPIWITEYAHETRPPEPLGIDPTLQARYAEEAVELAAENPRVRMFVWFVFRDPVDGLWQSGFLSEDGSPKPALATFAASAQRLDGRDPVLPESAEVARVPALELAYYVPAGTPIDVTVDGEREPAVPLGRDGWIELPLDGLPRAELDLRVADPHGHAVTRTLQLSDPEAARPTDDVGLR